MSPKEMFTCFLWQRRNSGLCVPWLTFSKLGDCIRWLLIPEKDFFPRKPESVLPASFSCCLWGWWLPGRHLHGGHLLEPWWGEVPVGFLLWPSVFYLSDLAHWAYFISLLTLKSSSCPCSWGLVYFTDVFIILFNLLAEFSAGAWVLVCWNSATQSWLCRLVPVREQLLGDTKISTESESKHWKTFRTIWWTFLWHSSILSKASVCEGLERKHLEKHCPRCLSDRSDCCSRLVAE